MLWLVTGGAGYIGSHVSRSLIAAGHDVVVIDNLLNGNKSRVPHEAQFIEADIRDGDALLDAMQGVDGVIHLAGLKSVTESIQKPLAYYDINVNGTLSVIRAMSYRNVEKLVFSSTASLYAASDTPIHEDSPIALSSPYAASKFMAERVIEDFAATRPCQYAILRYFNVAGATSSGLMDDSQDNLLPRLTRALRNDESPEIFGDDYPTRDGTCVRDYVHVADIADAHVLVAEKLGRLAHNVYNVGTGRGVTVFEIVDAARQAIGTTIPTITRPRRQGDNASTIANVKRIEQELGFCAKFGVDQIVECVKYRPISPSQTDVSLTVKQEVR